MEASLDLYEPLHDHLKTKTKSGEKKAFVYIARIGPVFKVCPSETSAWRWFAKHGYTYDFDKHGKLNWIPKYENQEQTFIERNYKKL